MHAHEGETERDTIDLEGIVTEQEGVASTTKCFPEVKAKESLLGLVVLNDQKPW